MNIPILDLKRTYGDIAEEIESSLKEVYQSQYFILGPAVKELEKNVAQYCHTQYGIGVASGTDALLVALMALGIEPGDYVITTPFTFFATAGSIARLNAIPVFVDIEPDTFNISPEAIRAACKSMETPAGTAMVKAPKAIIPVHLYGQCADMDAICAIAKEYTLAVVEDAAQAIGAMYKGKPACSIGDVGCLSFFPTKNLGGFGDGGMVLTDNEDLAEKIRMLRVHGTKSGSRYLYDKIGLNSRLDEIQAVVLNIKLAHLNTWTNQRRLNAALYNNLLSDVDEVVTPVDVDPKPVTGIDDSQENFTHIYNQYVIRAQHRNELEVYLKEKGVNTAIYYPLPLHLQTCFSYLDYKKGSLPVSEKAADEVLALPVFPGLTEEEIRFVAGNIKDFYAH